jgi:GntR family transcriptional regulator / MocR family aminotransferase
MTTSPTKQQSTPLVALDAAAAAPLYEQLYLGLRDHILAGRLRPGARIASTRALATHLDISRFTVVSALDRLIAEGYLSTRRGAGTFVTGTLPEQRMRARRSAGNSQPMAAKTTTATLSRRGAALSGVVITGPRREAGEPLPFRPRRPPLDVFPVKLWARLVRRQWSRASVNQLDYGDPAGYRPLRDAIAQHVSVTRGVACTADQVIVTSGAQQAFDILFRLLLDPGQQAWIEEPGYLDVRASLVSAGATLVPVPVDAHGIDVGAGCALGPQARLAVVSPSHQYPIGVTLSATRRAQLLEWARRTGAWIVEDDYDSYFRYRGRPMSALQALDADGVRPAGASPRVVYVSTFSKTMFPSLRLGFCVVPPPLIEPVANARAVADRNSPIVDQAALAEFIGGGHYDRHLRRVRMVCHERYDAMHHHFGRILGDAIRLGVAAAGTHVLGVVNGERRHASSRRGLAAAVAAAAAQDGMVVFRLSRYCLQPVERDALVLGYGGLPPNRIRAGAERLARVIEKVKNETR